MVKWARIYAVGTRRMIVETMEGFGEKKQRIVAVDNVGAGLGEAVLVATGSAARIGIEQNTAPIDAAIVGIIDDVSSLR